MADEKIDSPEEEGGEGTEGGGPNRITIIAAVLVALVVGAGVGVKALGPAVGPVLAARALNPSSGGDGGHGAAGEAGPPIHLIDNLVVNPARSGGTRFLLTTIAVEVADSEMADLVAGHDVELRDALIIVLGGKTTEELADIALRPGLIEELEVVIVDILGHDVVRRVYIPQFVIQ